MKQTIEIEIDVPDGYKAVYNEDTQRVIIIKIEKPNVELPKSWDEFCKNNPVKKNEYLIDRNGEIICATKKHRNTNLKNILPNKETAEAFLALMQLVQLRDCYRQGWKPDSIMGGYNAVITHGKYNLTSDYYYWGNRILSFQTENISEDFLANFRDLIYKAKELI